MKYAMAAPAAMALLMGSSGQAQAQDQAGAIFGVLTCHKTPNTTGITFIFHSRHAVTCTYEGVGKPRTTKGRREFRLASISTTRCRTAWRTS